jgi:hypothetical protein
VESSSHTVYGPSSVRPKVPFWQPSTPPESFCLPPSAMAPYRFRHSGYVYDVRFTFANDGWSATLSWEGEERERKLITLTDELARALCDAAVRNGFISVAEWLVKTGQWAA